MSTYEKFIEANTKLRECLEGKNPKEYDQMTPFEKESICQTEATAVRDFLSGPSLSIRSLLDERIAILDNQAHKE